MSLPRLLGMLLLLLPAAAGAEPGTVTLLAVNDVYRIAGVDGGRAGGLARLRSLRRALEREDPELVLLHAGDFLFPSPLSRQFRGAQMVDVMNRLDGDPAAFDRRMVVVFGNHEFDRARLEDAGLLNARLREARFHWLGSNIRFRRDAGGRPRVAGGPLADRVMLEANGVRLCLFGLTIDSKRAEYIEAYDDPVETARRLTRELRGAGCGLVVALTHLTMAQDQALLRALGDQGPDLVVGGHEHLRQSARVNGRWVIKSDADAVRAAVIRVTPRPGGPPEVRYRYRRLDASLAPDPQVAARVAHWQARYDRAYCGGRLGLPPGCLDQVLTRAGTRLVAEELAIRRYETNLGDWIADRALEAFRPRGAQVAFINSGSLRLNRDIPAGRPITRRDVEALFAYPTPLKLLRIDGATLKKVVTRAVQDWTGNGWWLQVAGFAFRFDPAGGGVRDLTLLGPDGPRPLGPGEAVLAVTNGFLAGGGDGYHMLAGAEVVLDPRPPVDLKDLVIRALEAAGEAGIAPALAGRICNPTRPGPCLAVPAAP